MSKILVFEYKSKTGETQLYSVIPEHIVYNEQSEEWELAAHDVHTDELVNFTMNNIVRMAQPGQVQRFLCVTVYVIDDSKRFLMLHNRKLNKWVAPGGKVDPNEIPDEAAIRETREETGIDITLISSLTPVNGGLVRPEGVQLNTIKPGIRDHIDLIYLARPSYDQSLCINQREASGIDWFTLEQVKQLDTFESTIQWCEIIQKNLYL
jgi:8-oxo-dGTP pyrophosphatase MutT (NUDIX family)